MFIIIFIMWFFIMMIFSSWIFLSARFLLWWFFYLHIIIFILSIILILSSILHIDLVFNFNSKTIKSSKTRFRSFSVKTCFFGNTRKKRAFSHFAAKTHFYAFSFKNAILLKKRDFLHFSSKTRFFAFFSKNAKNAIFFIFHKKRDF
jgi:hypothetical protein